MRISDTGKKSGFPVSVPVYTGKISGIRCRYPVSVSNRHRHRKPDFFPVPMYDRTEPYRFCYNFDHPCGLKARGEAYFLLKIRRYPSKKFLITALTLRLIYNKSANRSATILKQTNQKNHNQKIVPE